MRFRSFRRDTSVFHNIQRNYQGPAELGLPLPHMSQHPRHSPPILFANDAIVAKDFPPSLIGKPIVIPANKVLPAPRDFGLLTVDCQLVVRYSTIFEVQFQSEFVISSTLEE